MIQHSLNKYNLIEQLAAANEIYSYKATSIENDSMVFIKIINNPTLQSIFQKATKLHKQLHSNNLLTYDKMVYDNNLFVVEYQYLTDELWSPVTIDILSKNFSKIITQIAFIIDYLHIRNVVHNDLKLSNFLYNKKTEEIRLVDLDFLTNNNSPTNALILGTAQYIAPEIYQNESFTIASDNYALGKSIEFAISSWKSDSSYRKNLDKFIKNLTNEIAYERPQFLLDELHNCKLVETGAYNSLQKQLLSLHLLTSFKVLSKDKREDEKKLIKFISAENYIIGLDNEIITGLVDLYLKQKRKTVKLFKQLLIETEVTHINEYWHLKISETLLIRLFNEFDPSIDLEFTKHSVKITNQIKHLNKCYSYAVKQLEKQQYLYARLIFRQLYDFINNNNLIDSISYYPDLVKQLGLYASSINEYSEAITFFKKYHELTKNDDLDITVAYEHVIALYSSNETAKAEQVMANYIQRAKTINNLEYEMTFKRLQSFVKGRRGNYTDSNSELKTLLSISKKRKFHDNEIALLYNLGVNAWRQEKYEDAFDFMQQSLAAAKKYKLLHNNVHTLLGMALSYNEIGQYSKVPAIEKISDKIAFSLNNRQVEPLLQCELCFSYLRLNKIKKAEQLLVQFVSSSSSNEQFFWIHHYYYRAGVLAQSKNQYDQAFHYFYKLKNFFEQQSNSYSIGKVYHHLLINSFYSGKIDSHENFAKKANKEFDKQDNKTAKVEIDLHALLIKFYYQNKIDISKLEDIMSKLLEKNSLYYASITFFHLLLHPDKHDLSIKAYKHKLFKTTISDPKTPLYFAISKIYRGVLSKNKSEMLLSYKEAYNILYNAGLYFNAMLVCETIGRLYEEQPHNRRVLTFLHESLRLAKLIKNQYFIDRYNKKIENNNIESNHQESIISTYLSISEIFQQIDHYDNAIKQILELSVNLTGAERAVLLLKKRNSKELVVKGYINCDQDSLRDIHSISLNIPASSYTKDIPFFVENAQIDKRTKEFKSIIANNILSVLCIPVKYGNSLSGVLYLDHHSIPALFSKEDFKFIESISNFISIIMHTIDSYKTIKTINNELIEIANQKGKNDTFITKNAVIKKLFSNLPNIAKSNANILITGESGTGKEILAHMIHNLSNRNEMPLVKFNCAAISDTLIDSELFGIEKNTATGVQERDGKLSSADSGTLFMDEIGDMPLPVQAKLLRAIENQEYEKVGSSRTIYTDIRFIAATNKDLNAESKKNLFRNDLLHRINTITLEIPPLRQRIDDIPDLIDYFTTIYSKRSSKTIFSMDTNKLLMSYPWPGNVRELKNLVERCLILYPDEVITPDKLPREIIDAQPTVGNKEIAEQIEKTLLISTCKKHNGNKRKTADELKIPYTTLLRKLKKYNITC